MTSQPQPQPSPPRPQPSRGNQSPSPWSLSPPTKPQSINVKLPSVHRNPQIYGRDLLQKQEGDQSMWEYPFAVGGVNITFMLIQMLDLEAGGDEIDPSSAGTRAIA
ncbi:hypothetical protein F2P56_002925 [Juglans regia]|uniref:Uncharacterized protein LOC108995982 isoform X2 n=2 Tax=Juglans regia TaxID=51240 RepID=A0A2I4F6F9_JUGRE|nr:uncharacterized protein LOC108995982 isoform X2 [Juglans regia]KAF5482348.1 hypothetical protein F2P56_002925 [Juglans regia]